MLRQQAVDAEEERLREIARNLPDDKRKSFYHALKRELRDPDTYATLNWFFMSGIHHFYLKRWLHGIADLALLILGVALLLSQAIWPGVLLIVVLLTWGLWSLLRSQIIVQDWNNQIYHRLLHEHGARMHGKSDPQ